MSEWEGEERRGMSDLAKELEMAGIDLSTPDARRSLRDDIVWAHTMRKRCEKIGGYALLVVAGGVLTIIGSFLVAGFHDWIKKGP